MTLIEGIEEVIRTPSGGIITDEGKLDEDHIEGLIHSVRATAIKENWLNPRTKGRINPLWLQQCNLVFNKDLQEDECFVKFACPSTISLDKKHDGMFYIGTIDGNCAYTKVNSRAELSDLLNHRITKDKVYALYSDGYLEIWNSPLCEEVRFDGIINIPTEVPTYNKWKDIYPITSDLWVMMKDILFKTETQKVIVVPSDKISDSQESRELIKTRQ